MFRKNDYSGEYLEALAKHGKRIPYWYEWETTAFKITVRKNGAGIMPHRLDDPTAWNINVGIEISPCVLIINYGVGIICICTKPRKDEKNNTPKGSNKPMAKPWPYDDTDDTEPDTDYCDYCHSSPCQCDLTYELWRDAQ